jgi:hypothetical protein
MPTRELLAPSQRAQFTDFTAPLDDRTLARFYTLSDNDLELIRRRHRRASTQLGFAVQLGYARLPGRVLRVGEEAHPQTAAAGPSSAGECVGHPSPRSTTWWLIASGITHAQLRA